MKTVTAGLCRWYLCAIGALDLFRGFMHTFNIRYAASNIAGVDISGPRGEDFLVVMSGFGASNYITGCLFLLIALKKKELAPWALGFVVCGYGLATVSMRLLGIHGSSAFSGRSMMAVYIALSAVLVLAHGVALLIDRRKASWR